MRFSAIAALLILITCSPPCCAQQLPQEIVDRFVTTYLQSDGDLKEIFAETGDSLQDYDVSVREVPVVMGHYQDDEHELLFMIYDKARFENEKTLMGFLLFPLRSRNLGRLGEPNRYLRVEFDLTCLEEKNCPADMFDRIQWGLLRGALGTHNDAILAKARDSMTGESKYGRVFRYKYKLKECGAVCLGGFEVFATLDGKILGTVLQQVSYRPDIY